MSLTRTLVSDDGQVRTYEVKDGSTVVGWDYESVPTPTQTVERTVDDRLDQALDNLRAYVATASPTAAQTTAAVKLLCRVAIGLIRLRRNRLDSAD